MISAVVITVSDRCARGVQEDVSGPLVASLLEEAGARVLATEVMSDDFEPLVSKLRVLASRADVNLIVTTGGTGVAARDNTPEATRAVIEREVPGMSEAMRSETLRETPLAMISRSVCGTLKATLIVNLPGSPAGVRMCFAVIRPVLGHTIALLSGVPHDEA